MKLDYLVKRGKAWRARFRHPMLAGKVIECSADCFDDKEAVDISNALRTLITNRYYHHKESASEALKINFKAATAFYKRVLTETEVHLAFDGVFLGVPDIEREQRLNAEVLALRIENEAYRRMMEGHAVGDAINATIPQARAKYEAEMIAGSESERKCLLHRVGRVFSKIDCKLTELTADMVKAQIPADLVPGMKTKLFKDARRFLKWCSAEYSIKALERVAGHLKFAGSQSIARGQEKEILPVKQLTAYLANETVSVYWRGVVAVLAFSGLRLSELAQLRWENVDIEKRLLRVKAVQKELKTACSARAVHGLDELWQWLERLKLITGSTGWVFPRMTRADKLILDKDGKEKSWLTMKWGQLSPDVLSQRLARFDTVSGLGRSIPMRARRFCRTEMLSRGVPLHVVDAQMGHSSEVGDAHYTKTESVIESYYKLA